MRQISEEEYARLLADSNTLKRLRDRLTFLIRICNKNINQYRVSRSLKHDLITQRFTYQAVQGEMNSISKDEEKPK